MQLTRWQLIILVLTFDPFVKYFQIEAMSVAYYKKDELNNEAFDAIKLQMGDHSLGYQFVLHELLSIISDCNR